MTSQAVRAYQSAVTHIAAAAEDGSAAASTKAMQAASQLARLELNNATFKKLVKDHKVGLLLGKAFSTQKDPQSVSAYAASAALLRFLQQAKMYAWHSRLPSHSSSSSSAGSSGAATGSLAAEVRKQLQQSGLLQQLPRAMTAVAQQLEAYAAHPDGAAAGWQAAWQQGACNPFTVREPPSLDGIQAHLEFLLESFVHLTRLCVTGHVQQLAAAGVPAAARMSMLLLRCVGAASQLYDLYDPSPADGLRLYALLRRADTVQRFHQYLVGWVVEELGRDQSGQLDMHVYQLNVALAAAYAMQVQYGTKASAAGSSSSGAVGSNNSGTAGSSTSSSSGSSSSRAASSSSNTGGPSGFGSSRRAAQALATQQQASNLGLQEGARETPTASQDQHTAGEDAARAWQHVCEMASSLTPMQQQLFRQLGVDPRVLLWVVEDVPQEQCRDASLVCVDLHWRIFNAPASEARRQFSAQQQQRQQQGQGQPDWPRVFCLNLLLQCTVLPGMLSLLRLVPTSKDHDDRPFLFLYSTLTTLASLCLDLDTAVEALHAAGPSTDLQGFPLQACLKELLHNLLLLPKPLAALTQQQQQAGPGTTAASSSSSGSSGSSGSGSNAAGTHSAAPSEEAAASVLLLAIILSYFPHACVKAAGPAVAAAFAGVDVMDGQQDAQQQQQQQQDSFAELLRAQCAEVIRHLDSCVRLVTSVSTSMEGPGDLCAHLIMPSLEACSALFAHPHTAQLVFKPAVQAGPGSHEHWQLYSLLASMLKCIGSNANMGRNSSSDNAQDLAVWRAQARVLVGRSAAAALIPDSYYASDPGPAAAAATATHLLPSLVLIGRACLQWAQELQQQAQAATQQGGTLMPFGNFSAVYVCCGGIASFIHDELASAIALDSALGAVRAWLGREQVAAGVVAAGYQPQELQQRLELLRSTAAEAAASTLQQRWTQAVQALVQQLQVVGTALSNLAVPNFCNNSSCSNVSGPSELQLVSGRSCMCGGCLTARYCSKTCQRQHWRHHKPVCQALAAAAAAPTIV